MNKASSVHCVHIFAAAREALGLEQLTVQLAANATVADLRRALCHQYPEIERIIRHSAISLDDDYADELAPVEASEIALIPPVSGG